MFTHRKWNVHSVHVKYKPRGDTLFWHQLWLVCQKSKLTWKRNTTQREGEKNNCVAVLNLPWIRWMCICVCAIRLCRRLWLHLLRRAKSFVFYICVIVGYQLIIIDCCTECVTVVRCRFEIVHCTCWYRFCFRQIGCLFTITYNMNGNSPDYIQWNWPALQPR